MPMLVRYANSNAGHPILSWRGGRVPTQSRAADATALGCAGMKGTGAVKCGCGCKGSGTLAGFGNYVLPRPGAPEPINNSYVFTGGPKRGMGAFEVSSLVNAAAAPGQAALQMVTGTAYGQGPSLAATGVLAFAAYKLYKAIKKS